MECLLLFSEYKGNLCSILIACFGGLYSKNTKGRWGKFFSRPYWPFSLPPTFLTSQFGGLLIPLVGLTMLSFLITSSLSFIEGTDGDGRSNYSLFTYRNKFHRPNPKNMFLIVVQLQFQRYQWLWRTWRWYGFKEEPTEL